MVRRNTIFLWLLVAMVTLAPAAFSAPLAEDSEATAQAQTDGAGEATDDTVEAEPPPPRFLTAHVTVTNLGPDGSVDKKTEFDLHKYGNRTSTLGDSSEPDQFVGDTYYDYDRRMFYRKLAEGDMYFSYQLASTDRIKGQIFGYMNKPVDEPPYRLEVNTELEFDGHPCTLVLIGFPSPIGVHALHWVWEAQDLDGAVVRVVFPENYERITIVEYLGAHNTPFDLSKAKLPENALVMSGF